MNLRDQIRDIGEKEFGPAFVQSAGIPMVAKTLAERLFLEIVRGERQIDDLDVLVVAKCVELFSSIGFVTDKEPAVTKP